MKSYHGYKNPVNKALSWSVLSEFTDGHGYGVPAGRGWYLAMELATVIGAVVLSIVLEARPSKIPGN